MMVGAEFSINRRTTMKKVFALIFLASISSPAFAMPAIFGVTTNGSTIFPTGVRLNSEDGSDDVTTITSPGDSGDVSIDPNPIDIMPTLPDNFVIPPTAELPDPGLTPGFVPGDRGFEGVVNSVAKRR
ncbi:hypothetical protein [Synechococcus phage DSL-LC02]|nr:hypothetical protein [Synechococcus phage DSL-LC02]